MSTTRWFFILLAVGITVLFWQIISPFILTLITAGVMAIVVGPLEDKLRKKLHHPRIASLMMTCAVFLGIFLPLLLVALFMFDQATDLWRASLRGGWPTTAELFSHPIIQGLPEGIREQLLAIDLPATMQKATAWVAANIGAILAEILTFTARFVLNTVIFFLALYYFLVDREKIIKELLVLSPLKDKDDKEIMRRVIQTVRAVVFGSLIVALVQGVMASIGMAIFRVPGFLIWGALTVVAAQVPMVGVGLVMIPAILYLFLIGNVGAALGLLIWAIIVVGLADNVLAPYLIEGKTHMHALLILLSILGGLQLFGPIGLVVGPTVLAAFLVIVQMYKSGILDSR